MSKNSKDLRILFFLSPITKGGEKTNAGADYIHAAYDLKIITLDECDKLLKIFAPLKDTYDFKIGG